MTHSEFSQRTTRTMHTRTPVRTIGALTLGALSLAACSADTLNITNPNTPSVAGASADPQALQLLATGLLRQNRNSIGNYISETGRFGRESYIYTPQEGRNTSAYLIGLSGQNKLDPAGFATGSWGGPYGNLRDIFNFKNTVAASTLSAEQKRASLGFAKDDRGDGAVNRDRDPRHDRRRGADQPGTRQFWHRLSRVIQCTSTF